MGGCTSCTSPKAARGSSTPPRSRPSGGSLAIWVTPTAVGLASTTAPKLAAVSDTLFAVGVSGGKVRFARRDATVRGPEATGSPVGGIWLTAGQLVDPRATGTFSGDPDLLSWNGDVYLVANDFVSGEPG